MANTTTINTWQSYKLGEMAEEVRNLFEPRGAREHTYIGLEHIDQGTLQLNSVGQSTDAISTKKQFNAGEILFGSLRPYFRKVVRPKFNGVCSTDITVIRSTKNSNPGFLQYFIANQAFIDHATNISSGTRMPRANWKTLCESEWLFPPLPTQHKIAALLSAYDDLIENNLRRIKILEEMAQNLYREWFVKFRFPGHQRARFIDSPLGRIPEGWEVVQFTQIADVLSGGTPKTTVSEYWDGQIPFFAPKDTPASFFATETEKQITEVGLRKCNSKLYPPRTVFITARGTVGKVVMPAVPMAMNQSCYALLGKSGISQPFLFMTTLEQVAYLRKNTGGATFDTIVVDTFHRMQVIRPDEKVIEAFTQGIEPTLEMILNLTKKNTTLRRTRDLLLPRLISGELDVSELEITLPEEAAA